MIHERDADHDIADMLVRKRANPPHPHIEICKQALWVAENEGVIDGEEFTRANLWLDNQMKELTDANIHGDRVPEDRHCELLRLGQGDLERQDCLGKQPRQQAGEFRPASRLAYPVSESCPCPSCCEARGEN
jgi:hypothetical protein